MYLSPLNFVESYLSAISPACVFLSFFLSFFRFHRIPSKFLRTLITIGECRLLLFWAIGQVLQNLWYFDFLTWESIKNLQCGISRKRLIVERNGRKVGTRPTRVHKCRVLLMPNCFSFDLGLFGALCTCKILNFMIFKTILLPQFLSNFTQPLYKVS